MSFRNIAWPALAGAASIALGAAAWASPDPATTTTTFGTGGDEVSGNGEWATISNLDATNCAIGIYRLDYATMSWSLHGSVQTILASTCSGGQFGTSTALSGNVLVVGAPLWDGLFGAGTNNFGGIAIFEFDGLTWNRIGGLSNALGLIEQAPDSQLGAQYGTSVAISQSSTDSNEYLIAVGAPLDDNGGLADAGVVYFYRYGASSNALDYIGQRNAASAGDNLGTSVAVAYPLAAAGAPFESASDGALRTYELLDNVGGDGILDTISDGQVLNAGTGFELGYKVSISDQLLLGSGMSSAASFEDTGGAINAKYALIGAPKVVASGGGDVGQTNPAAFGDSSAEVVRIFRDIVNDDVGSTADEILVDVATDYATTAGVGGELHIADESLWLANAAADRAILYQFPCGYGTRLEQFEFDIISIPCDITGQTVSQVFGSLGNYDVNYRMWRVVDANAAMPAPTVRMTAGDMLDQNRAYWLQTDADQYFAIPATVSTSFSSNVAPSGTVGANVKRAREVLLPLPADPGSGNPADFFSRLQIANPFPRVIQWSDMRFAPPSGGVIDMDAAETAGWITAAAHVYDPDPMMGQTYRAVTTTPGFDNQVQPYEGFWITVLEKAAVDGEADGGTLILPLSQ